MQSFILTFLAEWGDRSQIATIAVSEQSNPIALYDMGFFFFRLPFDGSNYDLAAGNTQKCNRGCGRGNNRPHNLYITGCGWWEHAGI